MIWFNCIHCKNDFSVYPSRAKKGEVKYCSKECKHAYQKIMETDKRSYIKCDQCGKDFLRHNYRTKNKQNFCSYECMGLSKVKEGTKERGKYYATVGWYKLRDQCKIDNDYTCHFCFAKNERMDVHHVIPRFNDGPDELENLICVCQSCHNKVERLTERIIKHFN